MPERIYISKAAAGLLLCALLALAGCAGKQPSAEPASPYAEGQLVRPDGTPAGMDDFLRLAEGADYVLLGERHDNPLDHKMQANLLENLVKSGKRTLLGLEMLPRGRFDRVLGSFGKGEASLEDLPALLDWDRTWGFDFALYRPLFAVAGEHSVPVHGLNIPNEVRRNVSRKGLDGLSPEEKRELPRSIVPPLPEQRDKLAIFFRSHGAMLAGAAAPPAGAPKAPGPEGNSGPDKREAFERFLLIQSLWDSTMAEQAARILRKPVMKKPGQKADTMVVIAGGGHVEHGYGIAHRLKSFDPGAKSLLVMPFSGPRPEPGAADIFYYSPMPAQAMAGRQRLGLTLMPEKGKLRVVGIEPESRACRAGLRQGDILERAGSFTVTSAMDLHKAAREAAGQGRPLSVAVRRDGGILAVFIPEK